MTPQLRQAIRLLQLSTLDLHAEIQEQLDSNLMLEAEEDTEPQTEEFAGPMESTASADTGAREEMDAEVDERSSASREDIPEDLPVDVGWDDIFDPGTSYSGGKADEDYGDFLEVAGAKRDETLKEHLLWQLDMSPFTETDRIIAETIIDAINDDGYLGLDIEQLHGALPADLEVETDEIEAVLHRIQHFDPVGVAARTPAECLEIQLQTFDPLTPHLAEARDIVRHHLELLASRDFKGLARRLRLSEEVLQEAAALVRSLNPYPGATISATRTEYIVPDVFVRRQGGHWRVDLNADTAPRLRINPVYAGLVKRGDNSADNTCLRTHLQEARWFLKSLRSRNETLLKVAQAIVERQQGFLEHGEEAMQPLVLRDVAEAVGMHESTISRVTTQKYMHTPRGIFEFKYFFSSHVGTADGGECSATAIRAMIKKLISDEDPAKPMSDSRIATVLSKRGIKVARRTVAKYREAMNISASNERKRLS